MNHFSVIEVKNMSERGMTAVNQIMYLQIGGIVFGTIATVFLATGLGIQIQVRQSSLLKMLCLYI